MREKWTSCRKAGLTSSKSQGHENKHGTGPDSVGGPELGPDLSKPTTVDIWETIRET